MKTKQDKARLKQDKARQDKRLDKTSKRTFFKNILLSRIFFKNIPYLPQIPITSGFTRQINACGRYKG
jgi:hypothetical protein